MKSNNSIQFSIITPVYNRADCIKRCMDSVKSQSFNSYEFIIINDGSTDKTLDEIKTMEARFINLKSISYSENKGVNFARNRGIEQATGEFIIFLDSDDWLSEDALIQINKAMTQYPGYLHYLFGVSDRINDKKLPKTIQVYQYRDWLSGKISGDFVHVIRRSCFQGLMFVEQFRIYESLNWLRVLRRNQKQLFIPNLISYRERERVDSVTRESLLDDKRNMQNTYNYMFQFIEWYKDDYINFNLSILLQARIKVTLVIGFALGEKNRNKYLIDLLEQNLILKTTFKIFNNILLQPFFFWIIKIKSYINRLINK